jgi:hypothetical protein
MIKKAIFLFLSLSCACIGKTGITVGIGPNVSYLYYRLPDEIKIKQKPRLGFNIGSELELYMSIKSAIVSGIWYETRGAHWISEYPIIVNDIVFQQKEGFDIKFNYFIIPLLYKREFSATANGAYICTGLEFGLLSSAKLENNESKVDVKTTSRKMDLGLTVHLGYDLLIGTNNILFDIGYYFGTLELADDDLQDDRLNRNVKISIRYKYSFFKR